MDREEQRSSVRLHGGALKNSFPLNTNSTGWAEERLTHSYHRESLQVFISFDYNYLLESLQNTSSSLGLCSIVTALWFPWLGLSG